MSGRYGKAQRNWHYFVASEREEPKQIPAVAKGESSRAHSLSSGEVVAGDRREIADRRRPCVANHCSWRRPVQDLNRNRGHS